MNKKHPIGKRRYLLYTIVLFSFSEIDSQISTKLKEIDRMKLEVATLKSKRKRCDEECGKLNKRLMSCHNALRELPNGNATTKKAE